MFERTHLQVLTTRMQEPRKFIQVVMGPRQVGKTTMVTQLADKMKKGYYFISADAVAAANTTWLTQQWETARLMMKQDNALEFLLIVDEIQKISNWSETVKLLWDEDSRKAVLLKVILLGSSRLLLQQGLTESLAGRFETTYMGHWSLQEMQTAFGWTVNEYVWFGGYPGAATLIRDETRWKAYINQSLIETSISKDILMLTRIDKPALLKRLFELGCLYSGQILSMTKILGQLQDHGNTVTLSHYLELLDTAGLLAGIEKYSTNPLRVRSSSPKFQVHNTALISAQRNESFSDMGLQPDLRGRMVESAIGAHLINHALAGSYSLHYWRERNDEVDFVIANKGKLIGIEVKTNQTVSTKGMAAFQKTFNPDKILLIGDSGLAWQEFLLMDPSGL